MPMSFAISFLSPKVICLQDNMVLELLSDWDEIICELLLENFSVKVVPFLWDSRYMQLLFLTQKQTQFLEHTWAAGLGRKRVKRYYFIRYGFQLILQRGILARGEQFRWFSFSVI